jgi:peptidoglycan/LPS O-acetylase OafA/YrhL
MFVASPVSQAETRRPRLQALTGVRIFAALHIYLFHIKQAHDAGVLTFTVLSSLPAPIANLIGRGYVSTGFFFQLSGFLLAYAYLESSGHLKSSPWSFWRGRFLRLYPLYFLSLLLLAPAPALLPFTAKHPSPLELAAGIGTSLTLVQAWFPAFAIWWNAPAWALSAFAAFYAVFPPFCRCTARLNRQALLTLSIVLAFLSWLPMVLYLLFDPAGDAWTASSIVLGGPWLNFLRFNPLSWIFQFLAGVTLGRWFAGRVENGEVELVSEHSGHRMPSLGDALVFATLLFLAYAPPVPYVILRHGLLAPLSLAVIAEFARGNGILAHWLSWRGFARLSEASFSLFALQMPAGVWYCVVVLSSPRGTTIQLLGMIAWTVGLSVIWSETIQNRLLASLRRTERGEIRPPLRGPHRFAISLRRKASRRPI